MTADNDALRSAIGGVLFNVMNFPPSVQTRPLGRDMTLLNAKLAEAVLAAGFRLPRDVTDAEVEAAAQAFGGLFMTEWRDAADWERESVRESIRRALQAARGVSE